MLGLNVRVRLPDGVPDALDDMLDELVLLALCERVAVRVGVARCVEDRVIEEVEVIVMVMLALLVEERVTVFVADCVCDADLVTACDLLGVKLGLLVCVDVRLMD